MREPKPPSHRAAVDDEGEILAALAAGESRKALGLMMTAYGDDVYGYCSRMLRDDALAQDVHQLVFVQALRDLPSLERRSKVRTWLFGIASQRCLDAVKSSRKTKRPAAAPEASHDGPASARALDDCLAELAPPVRMLVLLRYNQGFTFEQMAAMLREKADALQARVARALPALRECLAGKGIKP